MKVSCVKERIESPPIPACHVHLSGDGIADLQVAGGGASGADVDAYLVIYSDLCIHV